MEFSEQALILQVNQPVLETGALAIELHSYAAPERLGPNFMPPGAGKCKASRVLARKLQAATPI